MKRLRIRVRVMMPHDTCISRVFTVALLQRLKMEALIPAPADCEVRSSIKFLKNKQRGMPNAGVVLLHDNSRPHADRRSTHFLQEFSWEVFNHPPYSPDLAPCGFHIFLHLEKFLSGESQRFHNDRGEDDCHIGFQSQTADFYDTGIQKMVPRYDKRLNSKGEYVEK